MYCPKVFKTVESRLNEFFVHYNGAFRRMFPGVYPATTINLGPRVITFEHFDRANLAYAWIAITSLGNYDYKKGGHIVLRSLGIIIEFPPGCTILFPSSVVQHCNTEVAENETRLSITQYISGSLIRWVEYGFRSQTQFFEEDEERANELWAQRDTAWVRAISLFSKHDELAEDQAAAFGYELE